MEVREVLIKAVLSLEWDMFRNVRSAYPVPCQSNRQAFEKIRGAIYQLWPLGLLGAYYDDLLAARQNGRNLVMEKYARMDNLIAVLNDDPMIDQILAIENRWQEQIKQFYPTLHVQLCRDSNEEIHDGRSFSIYLRSELETYGRRTLELYCEWILQGDAHKQNYSLEMLRKMIQAAGFQNLDHAETYYREAVSDGRLNPGAR